MLAFRTLTMIFSIIVSLLVCPPIFEKLLSMGPLLDREITWLWSISMLLAALGIYGRFGKALSIPLSFATFNCLLLISVDLAARATIIVVRPQAQLRLGELANKTYDDLLPYMAHPFLQFTGVPGRLQPGTQGVFNNFGFAHNRDFAYENLSGSIRIATIGGSTTANTYPPMLEKYLNQHLEHSMQSVEVLNFGLPYWTTAHSLVNFALNVLDFQPDYVVIHHAWNDSKYQRVDENYRGDYSHMLKAFETPSFIVDRYLIRASVLYRYLKFRLSPPDWAFLDNALTKKSASGGQTIELDGFRRFRRNIESIIDLSLIRGIRPVLTTMPHTLDINKPLGRTMDRAMEIDQANLILRDIALGYSTKIIFVDLDELMTGKSEDVFVDLAHVTESGRKIKAEAIGSAILKNIESQ